MSFKIQQLVTRDETEELGGIAKAILNVMADIADDNDSDNIYCSIETFCKRTGFKRTAVKEAIKELIKKGRIIYVGDKTKWGTNIYKLNVLEIKRAFDLSKKINEEKKNKKQKTSKVIPKLVDRDGRQTTVPQSLGDYKDINKQIINDYHGEKHIVDNFKLKKSNHDLNKKTNINIPLDSEQEVVKQILISEGWEENHALTVLAIYPLFEFFGIFERIHKSKRPIKNKGAYIRSCLRSIEYKYKQTV
jgi:hypothetical protein